MAKDEDMEELSPRWNFKSASFISVLKQKFQKILNS